MSAPVPSVPLAAPPGGVPLWILSIARAVNGLLRGKMNATGTVTLTASATTTTLIDERIGIFSTILLQPTTASAAKAMGTSAALAQTIATPANPAGTTSQTGVMMGLAVAITPATTGIVSVTVQGNISNDTAGCGAEAQLHYGTGLAPTNGVTSPVGTIAGGALRYGAAVSGGEFIPFCLSATANMAVGTAAWIDIALAADLGGTASISSLKVTAQEVGGTQTVYAVAGNGQATITHPSSSAADQTFNYLIIG